MLAGLGALVVGLAGAVLISRRLRRQTHGLGEREITRMYEYYRAVLQAVREGLLLVDAEGRVQLVNDEARRLLSLPEDVVGRSLASSGFLRTGGGRVRVHRGAGHHLRAGASTCW